MNLTIEISEHVAERLDVLRYAFDAISGSRTVGDVVEQLIDHAQQGVYRPGSWERPWLIQAFGDAWTGRLEPDPTAPVFDRPKATVIGAEVDLDEDRHAPGPGNSAEHVS